MSKGNRYTVLQKNTEKNVFPFPELKGKIIYSRHTKQFKGTSSLRIIQFTLRIFLSGNYGL